MTPSNCFKPTTKPGDGRVLSAQHKTTLIFWLCSGALHCLGHDPFLAVPQSAGSPAPSSLLASSHRYQTCITVSAYSCFLSLYSSDIFPNKSLAYLHLFRCLLFGKSKLTQHFSSVTSRELDWISGVPSNSKDPPIFEILVIPVWWKKRKRAKHLDLWSTTILCLWSLLLENLPVGNTLLGKANNSRQCFSGYKQFRDWLKTTYDLNHYFAVTNGSYTSAYKRIP